MFILASSVCKSLQCLISTLTQGGKGDHLYSLACSVVLCWGQGEENCKQLSLVCVGSVRCVWATLGLPLFTACVLSQSTLLRFQVALQGNCLKWALGCVYFPGLSPQVQVLGYSTKAQTRLGLRFLPFPGLSSSSDQVLGEHTLPGVWCILSPTWSQLLSFLGVQRECHLMYTMCLLLGADL